MIKLIQYYLIINKTTMKQHTTVNEIEFTRVNNDVNGNPPQ